MRYINLDGLPRKGLMGKSIDWRNTIGCKCSFTYDDINGVVELVSYSPPNITFKYINQLTTMNIDKFKKCQFGRIVKKHTCEFKIELGTIFKDTMRDITIIDREYRESDRGYNIKYYKYHCNIDGNEDWATESCLITKNQGCNLCAGRKVVKGANDIATTDPWMIEYFVNRKDIYKYAKCSGNVVELKCPKCDFIKSMQIANLYQHGFSCNKCSSGFSYPEKFMLNILEQLNVDFIPEYCPDWIKPKRYDFYIPSKNLIIEMDGGWHYIDNEMSGVTKDENLSNDKYKDEIANLHGIELIRINSNYKNVNTRFEFIKENVLCSELTNHFKFDDLDWSKINLNSTDNLLDKVCKSFIKLANKFNMSTYELLEYISIGEDNGLFK